MGGRASDSASTSSAVAVAVAVAGPPAGNPHPESATRALAGWCRAGRCGPAPQTSHSGALRLPQHLRNRPTPQHEAPRELTASGPQGQAGAFLQTRPTFFPATL